LENISTPQLQSRLRDATHPQHVAINHHPLIEGLTRADFPMGNYVALLRSYAALYQTLEPAIDRWLASVEPSFSYLERHKLPWLLEDLAYFAASPSTSLQMQSPEIKGWGALVGTLYAIEGSTLGGQVISRSLSTHHGLEKQTGARFFNGYEETTRPMWDAFLAFAVTVVRDRQTLDEALHSAQACFAMFQQALDDARQQLTTPDAATSAGSR